MSDNVEDLHVVCRTSLKLFFFWFLPPPGGSFPCPPRGRERSNHRTQTEDSLWETKLGQRVHQHRFKAPKVRLCSNEKLRLGQPRGCVVLPNFEFLCACRSKVGVFLCGPPQLGKSLEKQCLSHSEADVKFIFNKENFWTSSQEVPLLAPRHRARPHFNLQHLTKIFWENTKMFALLSLSSLFVSVLLNYNLISTKHFRKGSF